MAGNLSKGVPLPPRCSTVPRKEIRAMLQLAYPADIAKAKGLTPTRTQATCTMAAPVTRSSVL
jgi:DNA-directed RNA polymerase subunit beta